MDLAEAMEARAFGSGPRTRYAVVRLRVDGALVLIGAVAAVTCTLVARATGALPDWYPFPAASFPPISLLGLVGCALLAVPVVIWPRS